jgi:hypothetical protein
LLAAIFAANAILSYPINMGCSIETRHAAWLNLRRLIGSDHGRIVVIGKIHA